MLDYQSFRRKSVRAEEKRAERVTASQKQTGNQTILDLLKRGQGSSSDPEGVPLDETMRMKYEQKFGLPMDDVRIHRNSDEPSKYDADAFAFGSDIFLKTGKEGLISHEMTHVAQQKKGMVRPTEWVDGAPLNRSSSLEGAADRETVPNNSAMTEGMTPVIQLHPTVKVEGRNGKWKIKKLTKPDDVVEALQSDGYEFGELPEGCIDQAIAELLKSEVYYGSVYQLAHGIEEHLIELLQEEKYDKWLAQNDKFLCSDTYSSINKHRHKSYVIKHEAKPLARTEGRVKNGYIYLYHGGPKGLTEILPAEPNFRKDKKPDPSRDGFVSVAPSKAGITQMRGGTCYTIKLTEEEFKEHQFREYPGSHELRTRFPLPIADAEEFKRKMAAGVYPPLKRHLEHAKITVPKFPKNKRFG